MIGDGKKISSFAVMFGFSRKWECMAQVYFRKLLAQIQNPFLEAVCNSTASVLLELIGRPILMLMAVNPTQFV